MSSSQPFQNRALSVGLTEPILREVVYVFYDKVRNDEVLAPIFNKAIGPKWDRHIEKVYQFWLMATRLGTGYQAGNFMPAHLRHSSIGAAAASRWLALFKQTLAERCSPEIGDVLFDIANRMAENILVGLEKQKGSGR